MAKYVLNTAMIEEDFFAESSLFAIGSSLPGYQLCWWLNQLFGLHLKRDPELDICLGKGKVLSRRGGTLFDQVAGSDIEADVAWFPVFRHDLSYFDACIYLYSNRSENKRLVPELKQADYFLLIQYAAFLEQENGLQLHLGKAAQVTWVKEVDVDTLKSKRNLIL